MTQSYCLLTGGICGHSPIQMISNSFFLAEPYDENRRQRESSIKKSTFGHKLTIADNDVMNIAISCKICKMIQGCEYGIADISGLNNNVLIELGMLYGFNKPTIILVKREQGPDFTIPSNIIGLEQIRYTEFSELENKLKTLIPNLFQISKKREVILDFNPFLRATLNELDLAIKLKRDGPIIGKIIDVKSLGGFSNLILNRGKDHGVLPNMHFDVYVLEPTSVGEDIEYHIGSIQPINIQKGISQYTIFDQREAHPFWDELIRNKNTSTKHIVKSKIPSCFMSESLVHIMDMREIYDQMLKSMLMVNG